jgi:hypothetical protein
VGRNIEAILNEIFAEAHEALRLALQRRTVADVLKHIGTTSPASTDALAS